jgi:hypothetical protein
LISREDHLGPIRLWLLRLIDPIEWYMRRSEEARPTPHDPGSGGAERWNAYLPVERDASAERLVIDIAPLDDPTGDDADEFMRMHDSVRQKHSAYFEEKARDLLAGRDVVMQTTDGTARARLVRFRNGAVFENWHTSRHSSGHGVSRIERPELSHPVGALVSHLVNVVADMGMDARPSR